MTLLLLALLVLFQLVLPVGSLARRHDAQQVGTGSVQGVAAPPVLEFPESGLDEPAAYQGYATRLYRDAGANAVQVYLNRRTGRVVHLWADAANESVGFTARDSMGRPAALVWGSREAVVRAVDGTRSLAYTLETGSPVTLGLFLLGSMRVERDFQYAGRDSLPLNASPFPQAELLDLLGRLERLEPRERARHLALLGVETLDALRARLNPRFTARPASDAARTGPGAPTWAVVAAQESFDGKNHLGLTLEGDAPETEATLAGNTVTIRSRAAGPVRVTVRITTDAPALTPLSRTEIFNDDFFRFYQSVRADRADPTRFRRLEREVRGMELLCYGEKLMAGLPNFATYFGRDMLMTALLMEPVWAPAMPEHVIASALRKLSPSGEVSHEEALGGQAIRENAAEYNRLLAVADTARPPARERLLEQARAMLADLQATRENYVMVDDDFQLPVVVGRYLADPRVPDDHKRRFLLAGQRLQRLVANLALVARRTEAYARDPVATNLVSFPQAPDGHWISASWRDSRAGYGAGRFAMDVNVIWAPNALESLGTILDALRRLGLAPVISDEPLASYAGDRRALERAVAAWRGAERHFRVALSPREVAERLDARLTWLPQSEGEFWRGVMRRESAPADSLRFLALSLDASGRPIPTVNTDPAMLMLLGPLGPDRALELVGPIMRRYPWGLFVDDLGPVTANDTYASRDVWDAFRQDAYHSPTVVWGRDVNVLLAGLALQARAAPPGSGVAALQDAVRRTVDAVERSGLRHAELWSYRIENGRLVPSRYGASSDVQLWSLTDLAVQYLLNP